MKSSIFFAAAAAFVASAAVADVSPPSLVVVGDPQLHSVQGGSVFQTSKLAAWGAKVAQRYPEQNLLADYVFEELIQRASALPGGAEDAPVVLLGDGMNEACTGEFDRVEAVLARVRKQGRIALWAPGNHDVYLAGTVNTRYPGEAFASKDPVNALAGSAVPLDLSWWPAAQAVTSDNAWMAICADQGRSAPMNKAQWIRRYADSLGVTLAGQKTADGSFALSGSAAPGSPLRRANFQLVGRWYAPAVLDDDSPDPAWFAAWRRPYRSYIVQAMDVGERHRLVLIDTSVCEEAYLKSATNAGTNSCVPKEELDDIRVLANTDRQVVFGGHFPLADMKPEERQKLLDVFDTARRGWTYLSAHTHAPLSVTAYGSANAHRYDFNVGSTTDWPIEAHRFVLDGSARGGTMLNATLDESWVEYRRPVRSSQTELCRHLMAAERLAGLDVFGPLLQWDGGIRRSDRKARKACENDLQAATTSLAVARSKIAQRMASPEEGEQYRERAFSIFRGASREFDSQFDFDKVIP